jgi:hypothetical protein
MYLLRGILNTLSFKILVLKKQRFIIRFKLGLLESRYRKEICL